MRLFKLSLLGMAALSIASAGPVGSIEVGGCAAGAITSNTNTCGLSANYFGGVATADAGGFVGEKQYANNLFAGDTISGSSLGGSTLPTTALGYQQFTDNNNPNGPIVFSMDSDASSNFWASASGTLPASQPGATSITIPVGVMSVSSSSILMSDYWGVGDTVTVKFNYMSGAFDTFTFTNGIESASNCPAASPTAGEGSPTCNTYVQAPTLPAGVTLDKAWTASYANTGTSAGNPYDQTAGYNCVSSPSNPNCPLGSINLADFTFNLTGVPNYMTDTLSNIVITDNNNCSPGLSGCSSINSRLAVSAVDVNSTPEPSTVLLFATGMGLMGFFGYRRKVRQ